MSTGLIGIDVGSLYLKAVVINEQGELEKEYYEPHKGNPTEELKKAVAKLDLNGSRHIGITGPFGPAVAKNLNIDLIDTIRAEIDAVRSVYPEARNIINIGGNSLTMIFLDENGNFQNYTMNSLCAAGTGSFLDEQANRLGISYDDVEGMEQVDDPPSIATRCSVFAKSDLVHRQQQGHSTSAMWEGLCRGMTATCVQTLIKGKKLEGLTVITGGVAKNRSVMEEFKRRYGDDMVSFPNAHLSAAIGAARLSNGNGKINAATLLDIKEVKIEKSEIKTQKPLEIKRSKIPEVEPLKYYLDEAENEVRIWRDISGAKLDVYMGVDVGSTSTKLVLMDAEREVVIDIYRRTLGKPIEAVKHLFRAVDQILKDSSSTINVLGCGTTGSGRKLMGTIIGADAVINEITAHVTSSMHLDSSIETIFEIGGQDSKYMRTRDGRIFDSNMNYICAAGTGSFVEELANKLGFKIQEIGDKVMGVTPPGTSDRCTVFMEQDVFKLLNQGFSKTESMAAVMYSVAANYLNKVVGRRKVSEDKVLFIGATARNKGLVAAFENLLDIEVVLTPYCHVMGAYGVAMLAMDQIQADASRPSSTFRGFDLASKSVSLSEETCKLCQNFCTITTAEIEGLDEKPSWGYLCGREPDENKPRKCVEYDAITKRMQLWRESGRMEKPPVEAGKESVTVELPFALTTYSYYPLFKRFFTELGVNLKLTPKTNSEIADIGISVSPGDFCFPVKLAFGHLAKTLEKAGENYVFLPHMISNQKIPTTTNSLFCPWVEGFTSVATSTMRMNKADCSKILAPVIDLRLKPAKLAKELNNVLGEPLGVTKAQITKAWRAGLKAQDDFTQSCEREGKRILDELSKDDAKPAIVLIGRPYNTFDAGANVNLPRKIAEMGFQVIPIDFIPFDPDEVGDEYENVYWHYGQRIIHALRLVKKHPKLFAVYLTNFNCGPDSFLLSYSEQIMGGKPFLALSLDEHGADAGYITRLDAFLDVVKGYSHYQEDTSIKMPSQNAEDFHDKTIWFPPLHPFGIKIFAAAFRGYGYKAEVLPVEDRDAYEIGRAATRGDECLPAVVTIGALLKKLDEVKAKPGEHAFFMPTANGPCRFGQYALLHRMVLNEKGYSDIPILSPSSVNTYLGLKGALRRRLWLAMLISDIFYKAGCKRRPYEINKGDTDNALENARNILAETFEKPKMTEKMLGKAFDEAIELIRSVPITNGKPKPLVAIVGEIYVRCNTYSNEDVVRAVEEFGGEAWLTPMSEWILYTSMIDKMGAKLFGTGILNAIETHVKDRFLNRDEEFWYARAGEFLKDRHEPHIREVIEEGRKFIPIEFEGEAIITVGRSACFTKQGAVMVINCSPFSCMPGTSTSAIMQEIQAETGVPMVGMFYDGEGGLNKRLETFFKNLRA